MYHQAWPISYFYFITNITSISGCSPLLSGCVPSPCLVSVRSEEGTGSPRTGAKMVMILSGSAKDWDKWPGIPAPPAAAAAVLRIASVCQHAPANSVLIEKGTNLFCFLKKNL